MKRTVAWLILTLLAAGTAAAGDRVLLAAALSYLNPSDAGYRDIYGGRVFFPEAWAGLRVAGGLHLLGGYGWFTKKGTTPDLGLEAKSTQSFFWGGLGYVGNVTRMVKFKVEAGAAGFRYKEEAMDRVVSGSALGFRAGAGVLVLSRVAFSGFEFGYIGASDTAEDVKIKLGGLRATVSAGVKF